jgi:hypothetical protein
LQRANLELGLSANKNSSFGCFLLVFGDFKASKTPFLNFFDCLALLEWFDLWLFLLRQGFGRFKF